MLNIGWDVINLPCIPPLFKIVWWVAMKMDRFHIAQTTFSWGQFLFTLSWSQWTIWYPWKIFLWGGCKVGLISCQPNCLVFYSCFQGFFKLKLHNFNLKYWHFQWSKTFSFFPVITLDSYQTFNTLIYSIVTTRNFLKHDSHFRHVLI